MRNASTEITVLTHPDQIIYILYIGKIETNYNRDRSYSRRKEKNDNRSRESSKTQNWGPNQKKKLELLNRENIYELNNITSNEIKGIEKINYIHFIKKWYDQKLNKTIVNKNLDIIVKRKLRHRITIQK